MGDHSMALGGFCSARFDSVRELFAAKLESGEDLGASLVVNIDGETVVDLWGGWADEARTVPWTEDTIACVFSTTKTMTSLAALVLVDRGELELDATVASYWPEFEARGKAGIKVRQLLSHTSGVSGWDGPVTIDDVYDWDKSTAMLAAGAWWEPGAGSGYHALTFGHLIGEVIRRITGQRLGEFFAGQIAGPLGADFHIGLPSSEFPRVANLVPWPPQPTYPAELDRDGPAFKTFTGPDLSLNVERSGTERWRRADIGAANGHGNARSLARASVGGGLRRRSRRHAAALAEDDQSDLRGAKRRDRPRAGLPAQGWRRLRPALAGGAAVRSGRSRVFRGRRGRLDRDRRCGSPPDRRLRHEQDGASGAGHDRLPHSGGAGRTGVL